MLEARPVDRETVTDLIRLRVREDQMDLIASNAATIAQAAYEPHAWLRGLWVGKTPVGLIAMVDFGAEAAEAAASRASQEQTGADAEPPWPENAAYLWRLMIDAKHQGRGYGRAAIEMAFAQARRWGRETFCLHVADHEESALPFYRRYGLAPTGRIDDGEHFVTGPLPKRP